MAHSPLALVLLATALLLTPHLAAQSPEPEPAGLDTGAVDRYVDDLRKETRLPGLALAVVRGDETLYVKGYGEADRSGGRVTAETPFLVASVTKTFTALAILQLAEAGKLHLDDPVTGHLPWFRVADDEASGRITVAHLLSHSSGLPPFTPGSIERVLGEPGPDDLEQEVRLLADVDLVFPPGEGFAYSNFGFAVLGLLVETVAGEPYEDYVERHVFQALGMRHAHATRQDAVADGLATGHRYRFGFPVPYEWSHTRAQAGAGFTYASAGDLAGYVRALLAGGELDGRRVLSPAGVAAMHSTRVTFPGDASRGYGLGWFTGEMDGRRTVHHGGVAPDFLAQVLLVPGERLGVVVLMNANDGLHPDRFADVGASIASIALGGEPKPGTDSADLTLFAYRAILAVSAALLAAVVLPKTVRRLRGKPAPLGLTGPVALAVLGAAWALVCLVALPRLPLFNLAYLWFMVPDLALAVMCGGGIGTAAAVVGALAAWRRARGRRGRGKPAVPPSGSTP